MVFLNSEDVLFLFSFHFANFESLLFVEIICMLLVFIVPVQLFAGVVSVYWHHNLLTVVVVLLCAFLHLLGSINTHYKQARSILLYHSKLIVNILFGWSFAFPAVVFRSNLLTAYTIS